jgi:hypothetical protein
LTDPSLLADIAKNDEDSDIRKAAVERVTDQSVLADVAKNDEDSDVRKDAVERVTDQSLLADVAQNGKYSDVRKAAVELTDQSLLADIAQNGKDSYVRKAAVERLTDPILLADVARNDKEHIEVRIAASHQLVNYELEEDLLMYVIHTLGNVLKTSEDKDRKSSAAETLLAYYRRYRENKQGKEIRMYEGIYTGGYTSIYNNHDDSPHKDQEEGGLTSCCNEPYSEHTDYPPEDYHRDHHYDTSYTIDFYPEERLTKERRNKD